MPIASASKTKGGRSKRRPLSCDTPAGQLVIGFQQAIRSGRHWYLALLEAIGQWPIVEETWRGRHYRYLIGGEAFDWLTLAERLCLGSEGLVPAEEMDQLLFYGITPLELSGQELRDIVGFSKYQAILNYWYGVVVEEALFLVAEEAIRKENGLWLKSDVEIEQEAYRRVYGANQEELLDAFCKERGYKFTSALSFVEVKEFTYWLSKYRLLNSDGARVASDTERALRRLEELRALAVRKSADSSTESMTYVALVPEFSLRD